MMNEKAILPNFTEMRYNGKKCYIVSNDIDSAGTVKYYIKFADSREDLNLRLENSGCYYDEIVLLDDLEKPKFISVEELPMEVLIDEVERRKKLIIPDLIDSINKNIKELKRYGVKNNR